MSAGSNKILAGAVAGRQPFGWRWYFKLTAICFSAGALLEYGMIKSGFYNAVLATSSASEAQQAWQTFGETVKKQIEEKRNEKNMLSEKSNPDRSSTE